MRLHRVAAMMLAGLIVGGCALTPSLAPERLADSLSRQASAGPLPLASGALLTHNDAAFAAKLRAVESAEHSLDLAYYIFADDYTSSRLSQALIDAAARGVRVRLLVDYFSAYKALDRFSWLEAQGGGNIAVRFYNRPTVEILKDAAFLTLGCADVGATADACDAAKLAAVNAHFAPAAARAPAAHNRSMAGSGVFLSGLYGKHAKLMAYAITRGQAIDTEAVAGAADGADGGQADKLKALGKLYFRARYAGGVDGLAARLKLAFVRLAFAEQVNPVFDTVSRYLPVSRQNDAAAQRDWDYLTEFLHHKFLLADGQTLVLGGRNVADEYHMSPSPLADKYIFMDADLALQLAGRPAALAASFERLWALGEMVAGLDEVRQHAPNDLLMNFDVLDAAQAACQAGRDGACVDRYLARHFVPLADRLTAVGRQHRAAMATYARDYRPAAAPEPLALDAGARLDYLENLPVVEGTRGYGARHNREAASGKHIQAVWRTALREVCAAPATARQPVIVHNAYLFLPASLLQDIAAMLDGRRACAGVDLTLLTNSLATTDLNIVNLLAVWQLKALADHLVDRAPAEGAATLRYLEYQPGDDARLSLHAKVMVFGTDMFVGSANADVRSLMMDSNNGVYIRQAPQFVKRYVDSLEALIATPGRVADHTALIGRDAATLGGEMNQLIDQLLARYAGDDRLDATQRRDLKARILATTERVYALSRRIMQGDTAAADEFNALFKAI
ncbi:MAG: hypothetical protein DWQ11_03675 [Proteobacteria bacterium]|nr:MAG: hypothetical protein DWQ11_03675 [Pseudomonadota bacterium]